MGSGGAARARCFPEAKPCDYCKSTAALLFCRAESAFMCMSCDSKVHSLNNNISALKHERVWMCEVCEQAPASVTCKADAAALCVTCDSDIHCANPLARRHERSPVLPFFDTAESILLKSTTAAAAFSAPISNSAVKLDNFVSYITDSWISTNPVTTTKFLENNRFVKPMEFLFSDSDHFLDFDSFQIPSQPCSDSVVPVQTTTKPHLTAHLTDNSQENQFDIDFKKSSITSYNNSYNPPSLSRSISSSTMEVGVVPDGSTLSETSYPFARTMPSVDLSANQGTQVVDMDREARVLRYKEKKKNRKFEKTIRYASRKAYAETRPRIKGRFVKRTDSESDSDRFFSSGSGNFIVDARYGVVPSF